MWREQTSVDYWNAPVNVSGHTDAGQFAPVILYCFNYCYIFNHYILLIFDYD